jgi:hypothetical protein
MTTASERAWNRARKAVAGPAPPDLTGNADRRQLAAAGWRLVCLLTNGLGLWADPEGGPPLPQWLAVQAQDKRESGPHE